MKWPTYPQSQDLPLPVQWGKKVGAAGAPC